MGRGYALNRFEGLNNEPDMEAPWAYHYAGRPDRTAEVVHAAVHNQFGIGRGGLPGNDDSGGLSAWYVWAALGLFPVAGQSLFLINAPSFRAAELAVPGGTFAIETDGFVEPEAGWTGAVRPVGAAERQAAGAQLADRQTAPPRRHCCRSASDRAPAGWGTAARPPSATPTVPPGAAGPQPSVHQP